VVLPVGDINPTRRRAWATGILIAINAAVFLALQAPLDQCESLAFIYQWGAIPRELLTMQAAGVGEVASTIGEAEACTFGDVDKSVPASAISAMFLHGNLMHLLVNLLFLWIFGANVEDRLGHARYLGFYLGGGLVATYAFAFLNAGSLVPMVGASGAIAAVLGAYLICFPRATVLTYVPFPLYLLALILPGIRIRSFWLIFAIVTMPAWVLLGGWFLFQLNAAQAPAAGGGVAYEAHAAGFVAGVVLILVLDRGRQRRGKDPFHPPRSAPSRRH
jgi:membrane associated rhomboid family serine protease